MEIAKSFERYLQRSGVAFSIHAHQYETSLSLLCHEMGVDPAQTAVPVLLRTADESELMVVVPLSHTLDLDRMSALLQREVMLVPDDQLSAYFLDCEPGAEPAVAQLCNLPCIVDRNLLDQPRVFMRAGSHRSLISFDNSNLKKLYLPFPRAVISNPAPIAAKATAKAVGPVSIVEVYDGLDELQRMPSLPAMAMRLIQLAGNPEASVVELAQCIEMDPSVCAQVLRYARSPYYGYSGSIDSVQDAIIRVLGFDMVSNIALAIASSSAFEITPNGPLGLKAFWKHALYSALLCQKLAKYVNRADSIKPSQAYLCGLLHNLGVLLTGHLFPREFDLLNAAVERTPERTLHEIEQDLVISGTAEHYIRMGHDHMGGYLLERWNLPASVCDSAYYHHHEHYKGRNAEYIELVQASNLLLASVGVGDCGQVSLQRVSSQEVPWPTALVGLEPAKEILEEILLLATDLDNLADYMAA